VPEPVFDFWDLKALVEKLGTPFHNMNFSVIINLNGDIIHGTNYPVGRGLLETSSRYVPLRGAYTGARGRGRRHPYRPR
jgi:hypothetical protein